MEDFAGKVVVVTGGAGGIGRALAAAFVAERATVVIADVRDDAVQRTAGELGIVGIATDVSDPESVTALADAVYGRYGACHVLVNNAGVGAPSAPTWDTTENDWRWVIGVNLLGVVHGIHAFVPRMLAAGGEGWIVNTSSGNGGIAPLPGTSVYAASKAAVSTVTECLAAELAAAGSALRAAVFYPSGGLLRTGLWESDRTRPASLARERPRTSEPVTIASLEAAAAKGGYTLPWQDLDQLARVVIDGIRAGSFVHMIDVATIGQQLRLRAEHFERAEAVPNPSRQPSITAVIARPEHSTDHPTDRPD